eukprot:5837316-Alexandrium_andersonii.AAC.1
MVPSGALVPGGGAEVAPRGRFGSGKPRDPRPGGVSGAAMASQCTVAARSAGIPTDAPLP